MTERQLLEEHITELAEIVGEARKLTQQEYEDWKNSILDSATEKIRGFTELLIEQCL
jgi:plasmid replication initiation protein